MKIRRGFHRLGMIGLVPLAVAAGIAFLFAVHTYRTGRPVATYVVTGPDGKKWEWSGDNVQYPGMEQWLTNTYGKPIKFGADGVGWPDYIHARREAQDPFW